MDVPKIKLPVPIMTRHLNKKLDVFTKYDVIKKWEGTPLVSTLFNLYLFNKYKHSCLLNVKEHLGVFLYIPEITNKNIYETYINRLFTQAKQLVDCIRNGSSIIVIPLTLQFVSSGHANILIYRKKDNVIEHFEPHGSTYKATYFNNENRDKTYILINKRLDQFIKFINDELAIHNHAPVKLIPANEVCPRTLGLQSIEERSSIKKKNIESPGYCAVWSMFFTELVLKNPEYSSNELLSIIFRILDQMSTEGESNYLRRVVTGYVNLIYEKIDKYYGFILGNKKDVLENLFNITDDHILKLISNKYMMIIEYQQQLYENPGLSKEQFIENLLKKQKKENDPFEKKVIDDILTTLDKVETILHPSPISPLKSAKKSCPPGKILNPHTQRCVKVDPPVEKSVVEKSVVEKSVVEKSVVEKPVVEKSVVEKPVEKPCPPGKERHPQTKRCRNIVAEKPVEKSLVTGKPCPPGKERHPQTKRCRNIVVVEKPLEKSVVTEKPCPPGKERHPQTKRCRNIVTAKPVEKPVKKPCPPGKERNPHTKRCRNII